MMTAIDFVTRAVGIVTRAISLLNKACGCGCIGFYLLLDYYRMIKSRV